MSVDTNDSEAGPSGIGPVSVGPNDLRGLVAAMGELARTLHDQRGSVTDTLQAIVCAAVANVPGASSAGVTVVTDRGKLERRAGTDDLPGRVADLQNDAGEGPCLQCVHDRRTVLVTDMATDTRWPRFAARIVAEPIGSMVSAPLFVRTLSLGSLSLYAPASHAFDAQVQEVLEILASHAAVAVAGAQHEEGLRTALENRDLIGQAKGILMERHKVTGQQAFMMLVTASQARNVKLKDIASHLAATGSLD